MLLVVLPIRYCVTSSPLKTRKDFAPENPLDKSFKDITDKLSEHYDPKLLTIVERYHFHKRDQAAEESLAEYVAELRCLAARCKFGDHLDDALRDRFVCGIRSESVQKHLLSEAELNLTKAIKLAMAMEAAHSLKTALPVGKLDQPRTAPPGGGRPCHHCGNSVTMAAVANFEKRYLQV